MPPHPVSDRPEADVGTIEQPILVDLACPPMRPARALEGDARDRRGNRIVALAATGYAGCVFSQAVLPRWTGWLAVIAAVVNVVGTLSVFLSGGPFSIEGGWGTLLPVAATGVWYLGTSVSLFRVHPIATPDQAG